MLLLPIAIISWPILVIFGSILFGIIFGLFYPVMLTFEEDWNIIYGGFTETFKDTSEIIKGFCHSYFSYLRDIEARKCVEPFDINVIQIIIGLILAIYGSIVGVILFIIMLIIKLFPLFIECTMKCLNIVVV